MAAVKACNVLITGANRGLGLEMVKQLLEVNCPKRKIFAGCRDPNGSKCAELKELAKQHPSIITIVNLVADCSLSSLRINATIWESGLNLLVNNAAVLSPGTILSTPDEDMHKAFNTNIMGPLRVIKEYLPYLRTAAKACGESGMSCDKAAIVNISAVLGSMTSLPSWYSQFPAFSYNVSKAGLNMITVCAGLEFKTDEILCIAIHPGWVSTDMGGEKAPMDSRESVERVLHVLSSLTETHHGGFLDYSGKTLPW